MRGWAVDVEIGLGVHVVFPAYAGVSHVVNVPLDGDGSIPRLCGGEPIPIATEAVLH